jgi:tRNA-dihydrouridine synthase B
MTEAILKPVLTPMHATPLQIGPHRLSNRVFVAPMAGVTDRPYRQLCKRLGAGYAVSEMAASNALLWATDKTTRRINHDGETSPKAVQIAGSDPKMMAQAARFNVDRGAQIIDINMGCPAKKVCNAAAGSALMRDPELVRAIVAEVITAVRGDGVPVTLKMRTGFSHGQRNAPMLARMLEDLGVAMLTIHGRTRDDKYQGHAEYDTIAMIKSQAGIPIVANGDIDSPQKAQAVLEYTKADAVMIGRAAQGRPWIFRQIDHYLKTGECLPDPDESEIAGWLKDHLQDHYRFYGEATGVKTARKHIGWYLKGLPGVKAFRDALNQLESTDAQLRAIERFFEDRYEPHAQHS